MGAETAFVYLFTFVSERQAAACLCARGTGDGWKCCMFVGMAVGAGGSPSGRSSVEGAEIGVGWRQGKPNRDKRDKAQDR